MNLRRLLLGAAVLPLSFAAAQAQPGKNDQVLLQADQLVYDGDAQSVAAIGHVEMVDQGYILTADNVAYDQKSDKVTASGHVSVTDPRGNVAFADHLVLTDHMRDGAL